MSKPILELHRNQNQIDSIMRELAESLGVWFTILLLVDEERTALWRASHFNHPDDWIPVSGNRLDSGSMNARAFSESIEIVDNQVQGALPPNNPSATPHDMTASAIVLVGDRGTLEAIADRHGYSFDEAEMLRMRATAARIFNLLDE